MGMPQAMRSEYERSSLLSRAQAALCSDECRADGDCDVRNGDGGRDVCCKRLLLIHGLLDDNVHARHALLLLQVTRVAVCEGGACGACVRDAHVAAGIGCVPILEKNGNSL